MQWLREIQVRVNLIPVEEDSEQIRLCLLHILIGPRETRFSENAIALRGRHVIIREHERLLSGSQA